MSFFTANIRKNGSNLHVLECDTFDRFRRSRTLRTTLAGRSLYDYIEFCDAANTDSFRMERHSEELYHILFDTQPSVMQAIIDNEGGKTKY